MCELYYFDAVLCCIGFELLSTPTFHVVLLWFTVVNVVLFMFPGNWDSWFRGWRKEGGCSKMADCGKMTESLKLTDRPS